MILILTRPGTVMSLYWRNKIKPPITGFVLYLRLNSQYSSEQCASHITSQKGFAKMRIVAPTTDIII